MLYIKIILISFIPILAFGQDYYFDETKNSYSELSLYKNKTFSYTEESLEGEIVLEITGTYKKSGKALIGNGWDSVSNSKVKLEIYLKSDYATVIIAGRKEKTLMRDEFY